MSRCCVAFLLTVLGDASFQVGLMSGRNLHVRLEAFDGRIRDTISGVSVPAERRGTLELPERPPIGNR